MMPAGMKMPTSGSAMYGKIVGMLLVAAGVYINYQVLSMRQGSIPSAWNIPTIDMTSLIVIAVVLELLFTFLEGDIWKGKLNFIAAFATTVDAGIKAVFFFPFVVALIGVGPELGAILAFLFGLIFVASAEYAFKH
jgi:uncharacterized membrane protein